MIFGLGIDLCKVSRIEEALKKHGEKFAMRVLNPAEMLELGENYMDVATLAKAFAAKEAIAKALGTGIGQHLSFQDIVLMRRPSGQPYAIVQGCEAMRMIVAQIPLDAAPPEVHISLTDEGEYVAAVAVISMKTHFSQGNSF